ncbi:GNAT family N-acetyltransferase [Streptomyces sp. NBC_01725]|uniref:GNAT family N-acetyltransferase n=1 Tax=Streptomyces sp. NBC_01725 TaxID=2975923 RepID=UPI002E2E30B7|nr:GNAT family N-acetyltransferase [Streptomyces sp. NBC_01725]
MVRLRILTTNDWPLWREARLAALTEAPHAFKSRLADWDRGGEERWRARLETPGTYNVVASLNGRTAGMASGVPGEGGVCELRSVWVGPGARGLGVGNRLIAAVETWARRSGATTLKLAVIPGNESAVALYRRNGFVLTDERGDLLPDGVTTERVMAKPLRPAEGRSTGGT